MIKSRLRGISARASSFAVITLIATTLSPSTLEAQRGYRLFESDPVRPLALSGDGSRLYVVNTPDARLAV